MNTVGALPWYRSPVMIGAVVTIISTLAGLAPKIFAAIGLDNPTAIQSAVAAAFQVFALLSGIYTAVKRSNSTVQPLTTTQAKADAHPATVVAVTAANASTPAPDTFNPNITQPIPVKPPAVIPGKPWGH
jgi:hypothetical protein